MLETLDYTIRIGSIPTFLYFDLYLYSAYAAHFVYIHLYRYASLSLYISITLSLYVCILENTFAYPGEIVEIPYYGKMKQFLVTALEGSDGTCSYAPTGACGNYSLVNDFKSLNLVENKKDVSGNLFTSTNYNTSQSDVSLESVVNESIEGSMNNSDVTKYYSLLGDSIDIDDDDSDHDNYSSRNGDLLTSTPLKMNNTSESFTVTSSSYSCCTASNCVYYIASSATKLIVTQSHESAIKTQRDKETLTYDLVGGLAEQIRVLKEIVELPLKAPDMFKSCG